MQTGPLPKLLLSIASFLFCSTIILGIYVIARHARLRFLEDNLLTRKELQARLLEKSPLDQCLTSHTSSEVAYVLDPARERCTLWVTDEEQVYRINALGLRGADIQTKRPGVRRVVIVGDSWPWGVKLQDADRLESQLRRRVETVSPGAFEFVTVAMPGWNTRSEAAFLRVHGHILQPDLLIWMVSQNDVNDAMGVIAPGIGSITLSPQVADRAPIMHLSKHGDWPRTFWYTTTPMPFVTDRWLRNFALIEATRQLHDAPVLVILAGLDPHFVAFLARTAPLPFPIWFEPLEIDGDPRWRVTPKDGHPSVWGVEMQSLAVLAGMEELGFASGVELSAEERRLGSLWQLPEQTLPGAHEVDRWVEEYIAEVPEQYGRSLSESDVPGSGVGDAGRMADNGVLYLRVEPKRGDSLEVDLELVEDRPLGRSVVFEVTSFGGAKTARRFDLRERKMSARIPLPPRDKRFPLVEVRWEFDSMRCQEPATCVSATLVRMEPRAG